MELVAKMYQELGASSFPLQEKELDKFLDIEWVMSSYVNMEALKSSETT